jgi:altronate dehydratase
MCRSGGQRDEIPRIHDRARRETENAFPGVDFSHSWHGIGCNQRTCDFFCTVRHRHSHHRNVKFAAALC